MLEKDSINKMARNNIKRRSMGANKTEANRDTNKNYKMEVDWPYTQKNRRSSGETRTRLEPAGSQTERTSQNNLEEVDRRRN